LLERVLIVDNIDNAIKISRDTKYSYKIVTLDGDLFNIGGSMTGGSVSKKSAGIFSRGREIGDLNDKLNHLSESREKLNTGINEYKERLSELVSELDELKSDIQELNIARAEAQSKIEQAEEYVNDINSRINNIRIEDKQLENLIKDGAEKVEKQEGELDLINEEINSVNARLEEFQHKIQIDRNVKEESFEEISSMRVELNQIENDIYSLSAENKRLKSDIKQINVDISNYEKQLVSIDASIADKEEEILKIKAESDELKETYTKLLNELSEMGSYKGIINNNILELEKNISALSDTRISIEKELSRLEMQKEQSDLKSRELYDKMWEKYEITYVIAKGYEKLSVSDAELQREEKQLKNDIRNLGSVNMNAVEEYNSVKERFDFLTQNRNDIIETEKKLVKVIEQLNELMQTQFSEQFAIISKNFTETFKEMFGGGAASLKLNDSEDILNSGIDIIVQPPGKALQNMMLLSGGEKALTAIALLFAILKMKPSPFCILDEIEAALDDANVNRYAEYLDHFTDDTQFVVITHRKGTMEAADILYGVTMQEQGVSKLVSVDFKNKSEFEYKEESL
jgi:chromosome segregation protein